MNLYATATMKSMVKKLISVYEMGLQSKTYIKVRVEIVMLYCLPVANK